MEEDEDEVVVWESESVTTESGARDGDAKESEEENLDDVDDVDDEGDSR